MSKRAKKRVKNIKDRLKDNTLDLSFCDLEEVPVQEIVLIKKATNVNLSSNMLISLPITFVTLKQIVILDLSRNSLNELPEDFGEMTQLKRLDLYANEISRLPLSLSELKNLRWLDLKENPLTPAVATVAGPCSNSKECEECARSIVNYLSKMKVIVEEEKLRRLQTAKETQKQIKKETKEKKKKKKKGLSGEKGTKTDETKNAQIEMEVSKDNNILEVTRLPSDYKCDDTCKRRRSQESRFSSIYLIIWFSIFSTLLTVGFVILSSRYEQETDAILQNAQTLSGLPLRNYYKQTIHLLQNMTNVTNIHINYIIDMFHNYYNLQFR